MNMQNLMAQAQRMQRDIQKKQEEIYSKNFIGESQAFKIVLNGKKEIIDISINKNMIKDEEDLDALVDMIKIAYKSVSDQINTEVEQKLGAYANGLNGLL